MVCGENNAIIFSKALQILKSMNAYSSIQTDPDDQVHECVIPQDKRCFEPAIDEVGDSVSDSLGPT